MLVNRDKSCQVEYRNKTKMPDRFICCRNNTLECVFTYWTNEREVVLMLLSNALIKQAKAAVSPSPFGFENSGIGYGVTMLYPFCCSTQPYILQLIRNYDESNWTPRVFSFSLLWYNSVELSLPSIIRYWIFQGSMSFGYFLTPFPSTAWLHLSYCSAALSTELQNSPPTRLHGYTGCGSLFRNVHFFHDCITALNYYWFWSSVGVTP